MAFPKIEGYVVTERLGSGSYSTVYKAYNKVGGRTTVAIKCVDKSRVKHSGSAVDNLITEIRLMKSLSHPHIVKMHNFTWDDKNIYIILEYCCGGDLSKYIHRYGAVPERRMLYFLQQLASALKFLREKGIVHMDLKPHNLLLHKGSDGVYTLKVADFGFAQHLSSECSSERRGVRGSPLYMAPEMISGADCGPAVDLWSVGVIMYECLFGKAPYSSASFKELLDKIQRRAPIEIPPNSSISAGCRDLLRSLLKHDPGERISYEQFFEHEYLDLEHMPSAESYEKGVSLIKQAIEFDTNGQYTEALARYRAGLRRLVPCCRAIDSSPAAHCDTVNRLTRYMERAEAIKEYLKGQKQPTDSTNESTYGAEGSMTGECDVTVDTQNGAVSYNNIQNNVHADIVSGSEQRVAAWSKSPRWSLSRLLQPPPPPPPAPAPHPPAGPLSNESQPEKNQKDDNDTCRIT